MAMKSQLPAQYFQLFLQESKKDVEKYFSLYKLIIIYTLQQKNYDRCLKSHEKKRKKFLRNNPDSKMAKYPDIPMVQKDLIVELMRQLEMHLKDCFPNIPREMFIEQFNDLIINEANARFETQTSPGNTKRQTDSSSNNRSSKSSYVMVNEELYNPSI